MLSPPVSPLPVSSTLGTTKDANYNDCSPISACLIADQCHSQVDSNSDVIVKHAAIMHDHQANALSLDLCIAQDSLMEPARSVDVDKVVNVFPGFRAMNNDRADRHVLKVFCVCVGYRLIRWLQISII